MSRRTGWAPVLLLWITTGAPAGDVLKAIPNDALAVVLINRLDETDAKIDRLGRLANAPVQVSLLSLIKTVSGVHDGLDGKGSAAIVLLAGATADAPPVALLLVPITNYGRVVEQLAPEDAAAPIVAVQIYGQRFLLSRQGEFAVFAQPENKAAIEHLASSTESVEKELAPLKPSLVEADVTVVISERGIGWALGRFAAQLGLQGQDVATCKSELKHVLVSARFTPGDLLRISMQAGFQPQGAWARAATGPPASPSNVWTKLPGVPYALAGDFSLTEHWKPALAGLLPRVIERNPVLARLTPDDKKTIAADIRQVLANVQRVGLLIGPGSLDEPLLAHTFGVLKVQDSVKVLQTYQHLIEQLNSAQPDAAAKKSLYELAHEKLGDRNVLRITANISAVLAVGDARLQLLLNRLLGRDTAKFSVYLVAADPQTLLLAYYSRENLATALAVLQSKQKNLASDQTIADTLALLPSGAQAVVCAAPQGIWNLVQAATAQDSAEPKQVPAQPKEVPAPQEIRDAQPMGASVGVSAAGVGAELVIPASAIKAWGTMRAGGRGRR